jgi:hypothetical protein
MVLIPRQGGDNLLRRTLLQFLHEADGSFGRFGSNQEMKVIGHKDPAHQPKSGFLPPLAKNVDKRRAESLATEEPITAIGTRGDELQLSTLEMASIDWHRTLLSTDAKRNVNRRAELALRQPASFASAGVEGIFAEYNAATSGACVGLL